MTILAKHKDPIGSAVSDYFSGKPTEDILVSTDIAEDEQLSPAYFFRPFSEMPPQEQEALNRCTGRVLDIGACVGAHAIYLQEKGLDVTAIDISALSCDVMKKRGLKDVRLTNLFNLKDEKYDTILLLMNGVGVAQTLPGLDALFIHLKSLLSPNGKILLDSSDLLYLFQDEDGSAWVDITAGKYYGEVEYRLSYKETKGKPFPWLYVDYDNLFAAAQRNGLQVTYRLNGPHFDYLAEIKCTNHAK